MIELRRLSQNIVICQCLAEELLVITDMLASDKSQYFAQPRSVIVNSSR